MVTVPPSAGEAGDGDGDPGVTLMLAGAGGRGVPEEDIEQMLIRNPREFPGQGAVA